MPFLLNSFSEAIAVAAVNCGKTAEIIEKHLAISMPKSYN